MKLSLLVRIAEAFDNKEKSNIPFPQLLAMAVKYGYRAICTRASVAGIQTPVEVIRELRGRIGRIRCCWEFEISANHRNSTLRILIDLANELGAPLIRVCMKREGDIYWARKAADEAAEHGIRLAHQSLCASLFETPRALCALAAIGRTNFGLIYEPLVSCPFSVCWGGGFRREGRG